MYKKLQRHISIQQFGAHWHEFDFKCRPPMDGEWVYTERICLVVCSPVIKMRLTIRDQNECDGRTFGNGWWQTLRLFMRVCIRSVYELLQNVLVSCLGVCVKSMCMCVCVCVSVCMRPIKYVPNGYLWLSVGTNIYLARKPNCTLSPIVVISINPFVYILFVWFSCKYTFILTEPVSSGDD